MQSKLTFLTLFTLLFSFPTFAQDTLIIAKNYKYKLGTKLFSDRSTADYSDKSFSAFYGGLQIIKQIKNSKSSFESGIYYNTKAREYIAEIFCLTCNDPTYHYFFYNVYYHYLTIPVNYRFDTKSIYFSFGIFADYLLTRTTDDEYLLNVDKYYVADRKFFLGYNLNLGIEKSISYHLNIFAETRLAVTVSSAETNGGFLTETGNLGVSNVSYGFGMGINYKLLRKLN